MPLRINNMIHFGLSVVTLNALQIKSNPRKNTRLKYRAWNKYRISATLTQNFIAVRVAKLRSPATESTRYHRRMSDPTPKRIKGRRAVNDDIPNNLKDRAAR